MERLGQCINDVQAVSNTLQILNIQSSKENLNHMMGCLNKLDEIKATLISYAIDIEKAKEKENQNGTENDQSES